MATWEKHFRHVKKDLRLEKRLQNELSGSGTSSGVHTSKYSSYLPEYYVGQPNRIDRYRQYDNMDGDSEISRSLDTIADFCTQPEEHEETPFKFVFKGNVSETEVSILDKTLLQWCSLNNFNKRIWDIVRNVVKYGDKFFVRDPETFEWLDIFQENVASIEVNSAEGKKPTAYMIRNLDLHLRDQVASPNMNNAGGNSLTGIGGSGSGMGTSPSIPSNITNFNVAGGSNGKAAAGSQSIFKIDAENVVHLSLNSGVSPSWPFGVSMLESIMKTFQQKSLLEDAILIYRIQRAPERRVFYIDVGNMPPNKAAAYLERIKTEIHQKRIPNRMGGGQSIMDASYNPLAMLDDFFFAQTADGRGSKVETLPAGDNLGSIDDLKYFNNKLTRGLGIPSSYIPSGPDDGTATYNDGKIGTAYLQEYRFARQCKRIQMLISDIFDFEFKLFLKKRGNNIDSSLYELVFHDPQSFSKYRQIELDNSYLSMFGQIINTPFISKRYAMIRYLGWTEDEILENEKYWLEENPVGADAQDAAQEMIGDGADLGSVGVNPLPDDFGDDMSIEGDEGMGGTEGGESGGVGGTQAPGQTPTETPPPTV